MLVSVVIPVYNREQTISRAIDSVRTQSYQDTEIIVVDDGSTDGTAEILARYDGQIKIICQKNAGPSTARNAGIMASRGEIIAFLDSDDAWLPDKLARQVRLISSTDAVCCVCNARMCYADGNEKQSFAAANIHPPQSEGIWTNPTEVLLTRFLLFNQVIAVKRSALDQAGYFPEKLRLMEDYDLALRLSTVGKWAFIADPLVVWYGGAANSLSSSAKEAEICEITLSILTSFRGILTDTHFAEYPILNRRLWLLGQQQMALTYKASSNPLGRLMGMTRLWILNRYAGLMRRHRSFPRMKTYPIENLDETIGHHTSFT